MYPKQYNEAGPYIIGLSSKGAQGAGRRRTGAARHAQQVSASNLFHCVISIINFCLYIAWLFWLVREVGKALDDVAQELRDMPNR
jgi:hypothetical protein